MGRMTHTDTTRLFNIRFLSWEQFMSDWIKPTELNEEIRDALAKCDCFVGGVDLTIAYM